MSRASCPVVILLGAGASVDAGLSSSVELVADLEDHIRAHGDGVLSKCLELILAGLRFYQRVLHPQAASTIDIEIILRTAQLLRDRHQNPLTPFIGAWLPALESVSSLGGGGAAFDRLITEARKVLKNRLTISKDADIRTKYLRGLWDLKEPSWAPPAVFTLNYDRCVELALKYYNKPFTTGFRKGIWDASEFERDDVMRIYKLHGSFGWTFVDAGPSAESGQQRVLVDRDGAEDLPFVLGQDDYDEIIFAAENKLQAAHPFLWMAYQFSEAVRTAKYVVTIGYSFRDPHINDIIKHGMSFDPSKRLIIVDPTAKELVSRLSDDLFIKRMVPIPHGAKAALFEEDHLKRTLTVLEGTTVEEAPFR